MCGEYPYGIFPRSYVYASRWVEMTLVSFRTALSERSMLKPIVLTLLLLSGKGIVHLVQPVGDSIAILLAYLWIAVLVIVWTRLILGTNLHSVFGSFDAQMCFMGAFLGVGLLVIGEAGRVVSLSIGFEQQLQITPQGTIGALVALCVPIVITPIVEEFAFRGLIFEHLRDSMAELHAILLSALLFSIYHVSLYQLLPTFLLGVGLALVVVYTKSLWAAILAHSTFNALSLLIAIFGLTPLV